MLALIRTAHGILHHCTNTDIRRTFHHHLLSSSSLSWLKVSKEFTADFLVLFINVWRTCGAINSLVCLICQCSIWFVKLVSVHDDALAFDIQLLFALSIMVCIAAGCGTKELHFNYWCFLFISYGFNDGGDRCTCTHILVEV